jgi:hypothetical protein
LAFSVWDLLCLVAAIAPKIVVQVEMLASAEVLRQERDVYERGAACFGTFGHWALETESLVTEQKRVNDVLANKPGLETVACH